MKFFIIVAILFAATACSDDITSRRILQEQGYTDIRITGWEPFSCSDDDHYSTGFKAMSPADMPVEGVVCCGLWSKGCTIRF